MPTASDLRSGVESLATLAAADLRALWRQVDTADDARDALSDVLPALIATYGAAAATLTADWYDELREQAQAAGRFFAVVPDPGDEGAVELARWAVGPLYQAERDWATARSKLEGGLQRRIANRSRTVVTRSTSADPAARGWQRNIVGDTCKFCVMLAGRGAVYTEATSDFRTHDGCDCYATPAF